MTVEFVKTRPTEYSLFIDGKLEKTRIVVNKRFGIDQRALALLPHCPLPESIEMKGDDIQDVHKNLKYLNALYGIEGNLAKDYRHSYREVKNLF